MAKSRSEHRAVERIILHLKFDLARAGKTDAAIDYIERIARHPRLSALVFSSPLSFRLPTELVRYRRGVSDLRLRGVLALLRQLLPQRAHVMIELAQWMLDRREW